MPKIILAYPRQKVYLFLRASGLFAVGNPQKIGIENELLICYNGSSKGCDTVAGMKADTEYQIYIGCRDSQLRDELISEDELRETVVRFFKEREIGFSIFSVQGGYLHEDGMFISENTVCVNIIGNDDLDIIRLARSLSMFMNQEYVLVVKDVVKSEYC